MPKIDKKRPNRSDAYQYIMLEVSCDHDTLSSFSNQSSISHRLDPWQYDENLMQLREELRQEFWRLVDDELTKLQKFVLHKYAEGNTQMEIAEMLGVNQSSITKCLNGNVDYNNVGKDGKPKVYGGIFKKLRRLVDQDEVIMDLLRQIQEIQTEKW